MVPAADTSSSREITGVVQRPEPKAALLGERRRSAATPRHRRKRTGQVLQTAYRRSDFIESVHDGSVFAGDWTFTGLNYGCVEAAVMSGMEACRAICGSPKIIFGENYPLP